MCMLRFYYIFMESPIRIFMQLCKHYSHWLETELPLGSECCIRQWHSWLPPSRSDSCLLTYLCCLMYFLTDNEMLQSCICLLQSFPFVCYQQTQTCSILHCQLRLHRTATYRVSRHFWFLHYCIPCNFDKWVFFRFSEKLFQLVRFWSLLFYSIMSYPVIFFNPLLLCISIVMASWCYTVWLWLFPNFKSPKKITELA